MSSAFYFIRKNQRWVLTFPKVEILTRYNPKCIARKRKSRAHAYSNL
jgi:hypothetical protein